MNVSNLFKIGIALYWSILTSTCLVASDNHLTSPLDQAEALKKEAINFEIDGQNEKAINKIRLAKEILIEHCGLVDSFTLTVMEIEVYNLLLNDQLEESEALLDVCINNLHKLEITPIKLLARCFGIKADITRELNSPHEASPLYKKAYETFAKGHSHNKLGMNIYLNKIARNYYKNGEFRKAKQFFYKSRDILDQNNPKHAKRIARAGLSIGVCLNELSMSHLAKVEILNSIEYIKKELGTGAYELYYAYKNLADCFKKESDYLEALRYREHATAILGKRRKENHFTVLDTKLGNAAIYSKAKKFERGLKEIQNLEPLIIQKNNIRLTIRSYYLKARALMNLNRLEEAEVLLNKALDLSLEKYGECSLKNLVVYNDLISLYYKQEKYAKAISFVELENEIEDHHELTHEGRFANYPVYIRSLLKIGKTKEAEIAFGEYYPDHYLLKSRNPILYLEALDLLANIHKIKFAKSDKIDDLNSVDKSYTEILKTIDLLWSDNLSLNAFGFSKDIFSDSFKGFIETKIALANLLNDPNHLDVCLVALDKYKARILNKTFRKNKLKNDANDLNLLDQQNEIDLDIVNIKDALLMANQEEKSKLDDELFELETDKRTITKAIAEKNNWNNDFFDFNFQSLFEKLNKKTAILQFVYVADDVYLFYKDKFKIEYVLIEDKNILREELNDLNQALEPSSASNWKINSEQLSKRIFSDLSISPSIENLIIIPDEEMSFLNFDLLTYQKQLLIENYNVQYAHSLRVLHQQLNAKKNHGKGFICFSPAYEKEFLASFESEQSNLLAFREGFFNLPGAKIECEKISQILGGEHCKETEATETNFKTTLEDYKVIHLAMHGMLDGENEMNSKLVFSTAFPDSLNDNYLHAFEIINMNLNSDLVVLSACNSGKGVFNSGEGVMSLANAFTYAGVSNTVMSLWKVPDVATSNIMTSFYTYLSRGARIDVALKNAKLDYLSDESISEAQKHPYYWAGFIANGNMKPLKLSNTHLLIRGVVVLLFLVLVFLLFKKFKPSFG